MKQLFRNAAMLLLLCICGSVHAQMKVESFNVMPDDMDARTTFQLPDESAAKKNQFCAIIKVVTTEMDCTFDIGTSLSVAKTERKTAEIWVFVPVGTKKIKISHPIHGQLDTSDGYFVFPEKCKSGTVYRLKLHTEFHPDEDDIKDKNRFAKVAFNVYPKNANIILRSSPEVTDADGHFEKSLPLGIFHYRISADNYHYVDGQFELDKEGETKNVNIHLRQAFGWAVLPAEFDLNGCQFSIDGRPCKVNGNKVAVPSGLQKLHIARMYYHPEDIDVTIEDSVETQINPTMRPILGKIMVNTPDLPGSSVKIDGKDFGKTPFSVAQELIIGKHAIEVSRPNYVSQTRSVEIREGQIETVSFSLTSLGNFNITSTPYGASLYINNKYIGITPCSMNELASGNYDVRLEKHGYRTLRKTVHLDAAQPQNTFKMSRQIQSKNQLYLSPFMQSGSLYAVGATIGVYIYNVNIEASYIHGLGKSEDLYWSPVEDNGLDSTIPSQCEYRPQGFEFKLGYGVVMGTRMRITPQLGFNFQSLKSNLVNIVTQESDSQSKCHFVSSSLGARIDFALMSNIGIFAAPQYDFAISKSNVYGQVADVSSKVKGWSCGFNVRFGATIFF